MAGSLRDIKRRIKTVQSTKKITRAFELIATSKVMRAQQRMRASKPYADAITAALIELASSGDHRNHPYLQVRDRKRAAVVVVTADRGLAGAYSSNVLRQTEELLVRLREEGVQPVLYVAGRKGIGYFRFRQRAVAQSWSGFSDEPKYDDVKDIAEAVLDAFASGDVDEIFLVHTDFVSLLSQKPEVRRLLPLVVEEREAVVHSDKPSPQYEYEPGSEIVLHRLLRRYIKMRVFASFLEAAASELAARRNAMSTATENASELIDQYTRQYNQARQAGITQELMEVVGAAEAFKGS